MGEGEESGMDGDEQSGTRDSLSTVPHFLGSTTAQAHVALVASNTRLWLQTWGCMPMNGAVSV